MVRAPSGSADDTTGRADRGSAVEVVGVLGSRSRRGEFGNLLGSDAADLTTVLGAEQAGIPVVTTEYPDRLRDMLGKQAAAILYAEGDVTLLKQPALRIVGSHDASADVLEVAAETGDGAVTRGLRHRVGSCARQRRAAMRAAMANRGHAGGLHR